ncbi:DUF881 domain-containing protein [Halalkalibacterium ligniniphilum]|uniref:DUF881 domain-containing protein n=1 Tax=Halalkalibacterium ligniniphilum TaxID=1134413 RepID=UPI000346F9DF|nr:DUF881 domain-containing protein [Halalkalibacterium ligniniphilum]
MKVSSKHVLLSLVLLVTGFILALSYELAREQIVQSSPGDDRQWHYEDELRNKIILEQTVNRSLEEELRGYQTQVREMEEKIAEVDELTELRTTNLLDDVERLRKIVGAVQVKGPGIEISLSDSSYIPEGENPNNYIVHEQHVQKVVDELLVAGAEAIAINGYRISHQSYIQCIGPVIMVDGNQSYAPFTISAIGDPDILGKSITFPGGVHDQLINDEIVVKLDTKESIELAPYLAERG